MKKISESFIYVVIFLFFSNTGFSQDTRTLFKEGNKLFKLEHYRNALPFLEKVIESEPNNAEALYEAGVCYLHRYSKEKALEYILKSYMLDSNVSKYIHYWMGRAYHQNYKYDKAIQEYNIYKNSFGRGDQRRKDVEKQIEQTNVARELTSNPENFKVTNLGPVINTIYSEHSPVTSQDDSLLLFTSRRKNGNEGKEDLDGEFFEDIFQSKKQANAEWSAPERIHLNTTGHDASIQLFDNDTRMLLYKESKGGDIFVTEREGKDKWKDPQKFADINTADFEADAFITADGNTTYFATNHYKKVGDLDIYYITKDANGKWSKPKELEGNINTPEDEDAPFLSEDGKTLYFSSRGHKNMGGFDVFKSTLDASGNWTQPVNMGFPINTPDDDVYYYMSASGKKGFLSSYREGGFGEKDIYDIVPIYPVEITRVLNSCDPKREGLNYSLKSLQRTTKPVSVIGKIEGDRFSASVMSYNSYRLTVYNSTDTLFAENFDIPLMDEPNKKIGKNIEIKCPEGPKPPKDTSIVVATDFHLPKIYFETGKANLNEAGKSELNVLFKILTENPGISIEIDGHTDSKGSDELNQALSEKRAKAIVGYLIRKGIKADRLVAKGYGESRPISDNETEEGRKLNRRTEFKILKK